MEEDKLITAEEATKMMGFTNVITVWRLARDRKIEVVVYGKRRRFWKSKVQKYIQDHTLPPLPEKEHTLPAKE